MVEGLNADMSEQDLKAAIYWGNKDAIIAALQLSLASMRARSAESLDAVERAAGYLKLLNLAQSWNAPTFPVKGQDLLELGHDAGPELGAKLKALESSWVESGFSSTKQKLLKEFD